MWPGLPMGSFGAKTSCEKRAKDNFLKIQYLEKRQFQTLNTLKLKRVNKNEIMNWNKCRYDFSSQPHIVLFILVHIQGDPERCDSLWDKF